MSRHYHTQKFEYIKDLDIFVTDIEFYKATSRGGLDPIEKSPDSLHYRRSIVIRDDVSQTLWVIHGSGAAKKTQQSAMTNIQKINDDAADKYLVKEIEYDDAAQQIETILNSKITGKKQSPSSLKDIPKIPKVPKVQGVESEAPKPRADETSEGPEIKEFQISYFPDEDEQEDLIQSGILIKQVLEIFSSYINEVDNIISNKPPKSTSQKILKDLSEDIITLIYQ